MLRDLALYAGGGGSCLAGLLAGWRTRCAVELDPYCRRILLARQRDGLLEPFPIWDNITTFGGDPWRGHIDLITAGVPCQPWSVAGKRRGADDSRNLWPDTIRVVCEVRPRYVFLEQVPAFLTFPYAGTVLGAMAAAGYDAEWCVLGASDVGAPHRRKRLWILLADATSDGRRQGQPAPASVGYRRIPATASGTADVADAGRLGLEAGRAPGKSETAGAVQHMQPQCGGTTLSHTEGEQMGPTGLSRERRGMGHAEREGLALGQSLQGDTGEEQPSVERTNWWEFEPPLGRVAHGVAARMGQLRALGNGWVPLCAATAWRLLHARLAAGA